MPKHISLLRKQKFRHLVLNSAWRKKCTYVVTEPGNAIKPQQRAVSRHFFGRQLPGTFLSHSLFARCQTLFSGSSFADQRPTTSQELLSRADNWLLSTCTGAPSVVAVLTLTRRVSKLSGITKPEENSELLMSFVHMNLDFFSPLRFFYRENFWSATF